MPKPRKISKKKKEIAKLPETVEEPVKTEEKPEVKEEPKPLPPPEIHELTIAEKPAPKPNYIYVVRHMLSKGETAPKSATIEDYEGKTVNGEINVTAETLEICVPAEFIHKARYPIKISF